MGSVDDGFVGCPVSDVEPVEPTFEEADRGAAPGETPRPG